MRGKRFAPVVLAVAVGLTTLGFACSRTPPAAPAQTQAPTDTTPEFLEALAKADAAQLELQNGRPEAFKALWSRADDITLSGGFGGTVEKGWDKIGPRLDWVAAQYSKGTHTHERIVARASGDLAYVVQVEHIRFHVPRQSQESTRDYRVTMVFRREADGWRIVHRQADSQLMKEAPK